MRPTFALFVLAALAVADSSTTTISYFGLDYSAKTYGADPGAYTSTAASVVGSDSTATTYEIRCQKGAEKCALPHPVTLVQGSATYSMSGEYSIETMGATGIITDIEACTFTHTSESASCSWSVDFTISSGDLTLSTSNSNSSTVVPKSVSWRALEITAGADELTSTTSGSATKTTAGAASTTEAATGAASTGATTAGATSTGAAPRAYPLATAAPMGAAIAAIVAIF